MIKTSCFSSRGAKIYKKVPLSTNKQIKGPFFKDNNYYYPIAFFLASCCLRNVSCCAR